MAIVDGGPGVGDGSIASRRLLVALRQVGDGILEFLMAVFGLVIALSGFAVAQLERAHSGPAPSAIPSTIPHQSILPTVAVSQLEGVAALDNDDGSSCIAVPSPPQHRAIQQGWALLQTPGLLSQL